jgi:hypothetical protein
LHDCAVVSTTLLEFSSSVDNAANSALPIFNSKLDISTNEAWLDRDESSSSSEEQPLPWLQNTILLLSESQIVLHHLPCNKSESPSRTVDGAGHALRWFHFCFGIMVRKSLRLPLPERLLLNCGLLLACSSLSGSRVETYLSWYRRGENPSFAKNLSSLADNSPSMPTKTTARTIDLESVVSQQTCISSRRAGPTNWIVAGTGLRKELLPLAYNLRHMVHYSILTNTLHLHRDKLASYFKSFPTA